MSSGRLEDMSWRRFQDVLEDERLLRWRRVEDVFKTSSRPTNVCWVALEYNQAPLFVFADGARLLLVTDCRIGSMATSWQTSSNNAFVILLILLWQRVTNPHFLQDIASCVLNVLPQGYSVSIFGIGSWYLRRTASRNCCLIRM